MSVKRIIVDVSSVCWMSLLAGKDEENGRTVVFNDKSVLVNTAGYGYENAMNHLMAAMERFEVQPYQMIFVVEGLNSKTLRKSFLPTYKEDGGRPPEAYEEFNKLKDMLFDAWSAVGSVFVHQDGVESDDVIAYLARELQGERIILTNDGDLARLLDIEGVHLYRRGELDVNPVGPFPFKYITLYKALVGDTSDKIPGAYKFGDKSFLDLLCLFNLEGLDAMENLIRQRKLKELQEDVAEFKPLQKIIDAEEMVYASYRCATLYPDKVNTLRVPLQWRPGMVKPLTPATDERLKPYAGRVRLVHAGNYAQALDWAQELLQASPYVGLDIETSTNEESDEWLAAIKKKGTDDEKLGVDVFGSKLTSLGLTFGPNLQYTLYFTVDHRETPDVKNITSAQLLAFIKTIPADRIRTTVHNSSFELPVLYREWSGDEEWQNNGWHGFLPNVHDTVACASYVDENSSTGLKKLSQRYLNYRQDTYQETTVMVHLTGAQGYTRAENEECTVIAEAPWPGGKVLAEGDGWVKKSYRMNEMTAEHVLHYGSDDPICTVALYNFFRIVMEIEKTWNVFELVEQKPAYLTSKGFVDGVPFSLERLKELEKEDDKDHAEAWAKFRDFLIASGWAGTVCPKYEEMTPAAVKEAVLIVTGLELKTQVRTVSKFPPLILALQEEGGVDESVCFKLETLSQIVEKGDLANLNKMVAHYFTGEPDINFDSPKQMQKLLYDVLKLPVRIVNKLTPKERTDKPDLARAVSQHNKIAQGSNKVEPLTDAQKELLKLKAATDDTAVDFALAYDATGDVADILNAMVTIKRVETRRKLYYRPYPLLRHWEDQRLHSSINQNAAVTRRYSSSGPNLQQLPKKGEGVKVREIVVPHKRKSVVVSIDFSGQELRLMAEQSQDRNMLSCYLGEKKKDIHSITASGAMAKKWTDATVKELAEKYGAHLDPKDVDYLYDLFVHLHKKVQDAAIHKMADDLRKDAKNVNFAAQFDAQALKLSQMLIMSVADAQGFLDAKVAMFPDVEVWKDKVRDTVMKTGYALTMMGARRHLRDSILSPDKWIAEKAGRQGPNFGIQGSAAEMTKLSMARFWDTGAVFKYDSRFIAPIHDELVGSVTIAEAKGFIRDMHESMTAQYANMKVPVMGSISLGVTFGQQIECGDWFIEERIDEALAKCDLFWDVAEAKGVAPSRVHTWAMENSVKDEAGNEVGFRIPTTEEVIYYSRQAVAA